MKNIRKTEIRRKSMYGTVLFVLAIAGLIASVVISSIWIAAGAAAVFVIAAVMLYQVGKSLS